MIFFSSKDPWNPTTTKPKPQRPNKPKPVRPNRPKPVRPKPTRPARPKPTRPARPNPTTTLAPSFGQIKKGAPCKVNGKTFLHKNCRKYYRCVNSKLIGKANFQFKMSPLDGDHLNVS